MLGMMPQNKKIASLIIGQVGGGEKQSPEVVSDVSPGVQACAEAVIAAIEAKDAVGLAKALSSCIEMVYAEMEMRESD